MSYKVTGGDDNLSCIVSQSLSADELTVAYKQYTWVKGRFPLFVFRRLQDAIEFVLVFGAHIDRPIKIWRCRTRNLREQRACSPTAIAHIVAFWQEKCEEASKRHAPLGTYVADKVMITERVR